MSSCLSDQGQCIVPARIAVAAAGLAVSVNVYFLWGDVIAVRAQPPTPAAATSWVEAARGRLLGEPDTQPTRRRHTQQRERSPAQGSATAGSLQLPAGIGRPEGTRQ